PEEARRAWLQCRDLYRQLVKDRPAQAEYRHHLAQCYNSLGLWHKAAGQATEAEEAYQQAIDLRTRLGEEQPGNHAYAVELGGHCCNLGHLLGEGKDPEKALPCYERAARALEGVLQKDPNEATAQEYLRNTLTGRVAVLARLQRYGEAARDIDRL